MCGWLAILHARMIVSPAPQEMREGAIIWITRLLLEGRNPYALTELPAGTNAYGIVYHLMVWPFARLVGNGYAVHRAVSAVAIAASCALLYRLLRRANAERPIAAIGVMLFYASSLYFVAPLARPDSVGVLFCLASMAVLFTENLTAARFAAGLLFGLLALLTKIYLAYPPFLIALYTCLFVSPRRGIAYGFAALLAACATLWAMTLIYPAYINMSIVENVNSSTYYDVDHMRRQTLDWLVYSLPLTVGVILLAAGALAGGRRRLRNRPSPFAFASVVNAVVFFGVFGGHPGAHMTYLFHLVTPVLILAVLPQFAVDSWAGAVMAAALPVAFAASAHYFPLSFERFRDAEATFSKLSTVIRSHSRVLGSTEVAGPLALAGQDVIDSGHSQYFYAGVTSLHAPGIVPAEVLNQRWTMFLKEINSSIEREEFDLIIRSRRPGLIPADRVADHYVRVQIVDVDFPWGAQHWPLDLWEPKRLPER
jgi:hypothetical protein